MAQRRRATKTRWLLVVNAMSLILCDAVSAVVINSGNGAGNTVAPADDPGFANAGLRGAGTAVYLGNRWVLTASHVGAGPVTFGDKTYQNVVDETHRLTNPPGLSEFADLVLMRLQEEPDLPALRLGCGPVESSTEVLMVGYGHDRMEEPSFWSVKIVNGDNNDVWTPAATKAEAQSRGVATAEGFLTLDSRTARWGINRVVLTGVSAESGFGDVESFQTIFHPIVAISDLAQGIRGDSGGPVFQKNDGVWELVGLMHAIDLQENQPGRTRSAVFGNETFSADLFAYADIIREIADFEPERGDINADGLFDDRDIDALLANLQNPAHNSCHFDLDGDEQVGEADLELLLGRAGTLLGDADLSGEVDFSDFIELARAFGLYDTGWKGGDFNGDGQTTFSDFLDLSNAFGDSVSPGLASAAAVPEPQSEWPLLAGLLLLFRLRLIRLRACAA